MANYRFFVSYEGTRYNGWQRQGNTDQTVQGKLEAVLTRLFGVLVEVDGSGRTDAGVHALGQVANFHAPQRKDAAKIQEYLNQYLPKDICIYGLEETHERFHSRLSAVGKTYCYRIITDRLRPVFEQRFVWWLPERLDKNSMDQAAGYLVGTHDYAAFCGNPKMKKNTVRTIDRLDIQETEGMIQILVHGDGFLQNMVRILTGTLVEVGLGQKSAEEVQRILAAGIRAMAGPAAPPQGLFLESVDYDPPFLFREGRGRRNLW